LRRPPTGLQVGPAADALCRGLLATSPAAILVADLDGTIVLANPRCAQTFGYESAAALVGQSSFALLDEGLDQAGDRGRVTALRSAVSLQEGICIREQWLRKRDGTRTPVEVRASVIRESASAPSWLLVVVRDIAERKQRDAQYDAVFAATGDGLVIYTLEGVIVEANPAFCTMNGYTREELLGQHVTMLIHPDSHPLFWTFVDTIARGGALYARATNVRKDGTSFPVDVHGTVVLYAGVPHILGVARDVTAAVQAEAQLREKEQQYRGIFEATSDGVLISDLDGYVVEANPAACRMHGYAPEEFVGLPRTAYVQPDATGLVPASGGGSGDQGSFATLAVHVRKDGTACPVDVRRASFVYRGTPHTLDVLRDVTEQVRAYELLEQRVAERTRELATLLEVSHTVAAILELGPLLELILDQLRMVTDYRRAALLGLQDHHLVVLARRTGGPDATGGPPNIPLRTLDPLWEALRCGETLLVDEGQAADPLARALRVALGGDADSSVRADRSWLAVPLVIQERTIGALTLAHDQPGYYTAHHAQLARTIANQAAIAIENARLYAQAPRAAALDERQRLARELHDAVTQTLFSASIMAEMLPRLWARDPEAGKKRLEDVRALTRGALAEMRTLLLELRPTALVEAELGDLLRQLGEVLTGRTGIPVRLVLEGAGRLPAEVRLAVYRVAQEALHNVDKHARAAHVEVCLRSRAGGVDLWIRDDGCGFDPRAQSAAHFGLSNMRERARALGATLNVHSRPGGGTEVHLQWRATQGGEGG
jgi:two-component system nitrate/nitrite sensor histidine kinase NarX